MINVSQYLYKKWIYRYINNAIMVYLFYLKMLPKSLKKGEKPYKCDQCSYVCVQSSNLTKHKQTHTGSFFRCMSQSILKQYFCDRCSMVQNSKFWTDFFKREHKPLENYKIFIRSQNFFMRSKIFWRVKFAKNLRSDQKICDQIKFFIIF